MKQPLVIASTVKIVEEVWTVLFKDYRIIECESISKLEDLINENDARVLILDLDSISADNNFLKRLKTASQQLTILAVSNRKLHPELRESICSHIHACLSKPIDSEELGFWLRTIKQDNQSRDQIHENSSASHSASASKNTRR